MKVNYIKNIDKFFDVVKKCASEVYITSIDGTKIALNSSIGRFVTKAIFNNDKDREVIGDFEIETSNMDDLAIIVNFLTNQ